MTALMIQGTGSDVGKSLFVAGLCRLLTNRGYRVRPFKPQNMSNNAAVTADGGEIERAQALQARAARVPLSVHMNPVLLKPQSDVGSQVIAQGRMMGNARAAEFQTWKPRLAAAVAENFARLNAEADIVIVEGAGSAAEVNLRANDIANMGFARAHGVPVVLLADIDRGGVIAQVVGTKAVIDDADAALVRGFVVNKFRGDPALFAAGMDLMAERTGWPALGLVPYFRDAARLPAEDGQVLQRARAPSGDGLTIAVPVLPHISNFDDLDPLAAEPGVRLIMLRRGQPIPAETGLVILPGSKATIADLAALRAEGWDIDILAHRRRGGHVLGICGGYQMLGRVIADPEGIEGAPSSVPGLGLLDVATVMTADKTLVEVAGRHAGGAALEGYEMHVGETTGADRARPFATLADGEPDGATSADGRVAGTYLHGIFTSDTFRADLLGLFGATSMPGHDAETDRVLDALADHIAAHVDLARMFDGVIEWPLPLSSPHGRYAVRLTFLAFLFSQPFALLCFAVVGGFRPGVATDWSFFLMFEICAVLSTAFAGASAGLLAWRGTAFGPALAVTLAVVAVVTARIVTASFYFAALTLPYAIATSLALSWLIPEIVAGVTAYVLHRRVFGTARGADAGQPA